MLPLDGALVVTGPSVTGGALVGASVFGVGGKVTVIRYENQNFISSIKCVKNTMKMRGFIGSVGLSVDLEASPTYFHGYFKTHDIYYLPSKTK